MGINIALSREDEERLEIIEQILKELDNKGYKRNGNQVGGVSRLIAWYNGVSSPRLGMGAKHEDTGMTLVKPHYPLVSTGMHSMLLDQQATTVPHDSVIVEIIKRNKNHYVIIYKRTDNGQHGAIEVSNYIHSTQKYGFILEFTDLFKSLDVGSYLVKGEWLAAPPSAVVGSNSVNLTIANLTHWFLAEDTYVISLEAARMLDCWIIGETAMNIKPDEVLLNAHGDEDNYKPLPEVGDIIKNEIIMAKRQIPYPMTGALGTARDMCRLDDAFDDIYTVNSSYIEIIDVEIIGDYDPNNEVQIFHKKIGEVYNRVYRSVDDQLTGMITNSLARTDKSMPKNHKFTTVKKRIVIKYKYVHQTNLKSKIVPETGGKGIVGAVIPTEDMPVTKEGRRIHVLCGASGTANRNNPTKDIKAIVAMASQIAKELMMKHVDDNIGSDMPGDYAFSILNSCPIGDINIAFNILTDVLEATESPLHETYLSATDGEQRQVVHHVYHNCLTIMAPMPNVSPLSLLTKLRATKFCPPMATVHMKDDEGNVVAIDDVLIGIEAFYHLNKLGDDWSAVTLPFLNPYELPTSLSSDRKKTWKYSHSPVSAFDETMTRVSMQHMPQETFAEMIDIAKSPVSGNLVYRAFLEHTTPTNIDKIIDRDKHPLGRDPHSLLYESITLCGGTTLKYEDTGYQEDDKLDSKIVTEKFKI